MIYHVNSILLSEDGSGELWYGEHAAFTFDTYYKDVVAMLGKDITRDDAGRLWLGIKEFGRVDGDVIKWVNQRRFIEAVSQ